MLNAAKIEVLNCNHGGFYSVGTWGGQLLGQVQRITARQWAARKHGAYRDADPPVFATRRDAVAYLVENTR